MEGDENNLKKIRLPAKEMAVHRVAGNAVHRYLNKSTVLEVKLIEVDENRLYKFETDLEFPFNEIYIRVANKRINIPEGKASFKPKEFEEIDAADEATIFDWDQYPEDFIINEPSEIPGSWQGKFSFSKDNPGANQMGLRLPQIGALHALSAHLCTDKPLEPATVVLPTGTGKTETMLAALAYHQCAKLLVVVPSNSLREQIADKFLSMGYLSELNVLPFLIQLPAVLKLKRGITGVAQAEELLGVSNVIVATVSILTSSDQDAIDRLCQGCTHLFIDEAHHVSAKSWSAIRHRFEGRPVIQFTATPFRNDGNSLGGRLIYNYTMGEAQRAGYFRSVHLCPVEEYYDESSDRTIATEAVGVLQRDIDNGFDHLMMARVNSKVRADELCKLYREIAPHFSPIVVHSGLTQVRNRELLDFLHSRASRIVICVDMLGEGYDLPNLKIAAIHDNHKSLAITLQFIGRFTRSARGLPIGDASVVVNVADPEVENGLEKLYSQGADWDQVLRRLAEERIEKELNLQHIVDSLKSGDGNLGEQLSLWNIRPSYSAMLFKTECEDWEPKKFASDLKRYSDFWYSVAHDEKILVVLAVQNAPVKWGDFKNISDITYKLLIAFWDSGRQALFFFSNDYVGFDVEKMAKNLCGDNTELVSGDKVFNVFNGVEYPLVRNLGASQIGAISFTQFFGPNVTDGLSSIEASQSTLSNIAGMGYENGEKVLWGCSQKKGKIWSPQSPGTIPDWCDWVQGAWDKITGGALDEDNITRDFLRPTKIDAQYGEYPVSANWGEFIQTVYEDKVSVFFGGNEIPFFLVDLSTEGRDAQGDIILAVSAEALRSKYRLAITGGVPGYSYELIDGEPISVKTGNSDAVTFPEYMIKDPINIQYSDGSFSYNCYLVKVPDEIGFFPREGLVQGNWQGVTITSESMGYAQDKSTIQYRMYEEMEPDFDLIINDDGSGESADLVGLKVVDDEILLSFVHCKYSKKATPGARVSDLYEVCGQAQRSIKWKHQGLKHFYRHIKHREDLWQAKGHTRFLKGNLSDLVSLRNKSRTCKTRFEVKIVQPGVSLQEVNDELLKLLGSTALYIKKTTQADLSVIISG